MTSLRHLLRKLEVQQKDRIAALHNVSVLFILTQKRQDRLQLVFSDSNIDFEVAVFDLFQEEEQVVQHHFDDRQRRGQRIFKLLLKVSVHLLGCLVLVVLESLVRSRGVPV